MSFDPTRGGFGIGRDEPFRVTEFDRVTADKLDDDEVAEIEAAVRTRDDLITTLQSKVVEVRSERDALAHRIDRLEAERDDLRQRVEDLEVDLPTLDPGSVVSTFGAAFDDAEADLAAANYAVGEVQVDLKANVVSTDEGVRFHLPSATERLPAGSLSTLTFTLGARTDDRDSLGYEEIPDVRYVAQSTARERCEAAGFVVGDVESVADEEPSGTVVAQFPSPYSLAEPGTAVDLTVSTGPQDEVDRVIDEREVGESDADERDGDDGGADERGVDFDPRDFTLVDGVGPTYADRLERSDVETIFELAEADPGELATVLEASEGRAKDIVLSARKFVEVHG